MSPTTTAPATVGPATAAQARAALDAHVRETVAWHFSPATGTPFWLDKAAELGLDPTREITAFDDLVLLPRFDDEWLRSEPQQRFIPRAFGGRPFRVFETGGTTGVPKQRLSWDDHLIDYERFSDTLDPAHFPPGAAWLMLGPTGPRRLRLTIEHLANHRGGPAYHVDVDPRWVKRLAADGRLREIQAYKRHVVDQAIRLLRHRDIAVVFTTPLLLEALGDAFDLAAAGVRGVFCGGTSMTPQTIRFLCEELLGPEIQLVPTYGNTLMGLATCEPASAARGYALTYHAPQPRAVLRVVDPDDPDHEVPVGAWGRVELTTLTRELFLPRFLERDEAQRRPPSSRWPWDGVGDVRPLRSGGALAIEGVY